MPVKHVSGIVTGPGGSNTCSTQLSVTPPPTCSPVFEIQNIGTGLHEVGGKVTVSANWKAQGYTDVSVLLHWEHGSSTYIKEAKSFSVLCTEGLKDGRIEWSSSQLDHLPSRGAKYKIILVKGTVGVGPVPHGLVLLSPEFKFSWP